MRNSLVLLVFAFLFVIFIGLGSSEDYIISNSEDWRDVYSIIHFSNLKGVSSDFLVSSLHGGILLQSTNRENNITIYTSSDVPFVIGYESIANAMGYDYVEEVEFDNANLELIEELPQIDNFVIVGNTYGYSAIAVAGYSVISNSWVFMADRNNIEEIDEIISERNTGDVLIYGYVDREVREILSKYNPEIIDTGDRFNDNIAIVEKYLEIKPMKQAVLTNGEFIEKEVMGGAEPVLFTGKENVPEQIGEYLRAGDIEIGVLVGSDLIGSATNIRRSTGINVIVKFARGSRRAAGGIAPVEGLDLFYLPVPQLNLSIYSLKYNRATDRLEVTYKSNANAPLYFRGTISYERAAGGTSRVGDASPVFIAPNEYKTISYSDVDLNEQEAFVDLLTLYGETSSALEKILQARLEVEFVNVLDGCEMDLDKIKYSTSKKAFYIYVKNSAEVDCWASGELVDVFLDGRKVILSTEGALNVPSKRSRTLIIREELLEEDLVRNEVVNTWVYYGEREDGLVKAINKPLKLKVEFISVMLIILIILIVLVLAWIIFLLWRRRNKEDDDW
jgi:hypothetical protein